jgi:hypothetical protein
MSYTINNSDGTLLTTIADGSYDATSTSLFLPGPNFLGYGEHLNENLISLLENFAANTAPSGTNQIGQLWYNKSAQTLNVFVGPTQGYVNVTGLTISSTQPLNPIAGNTWYNSSTAQLYFFDGSAWTLIGPTFTKTQGLSGAIPVSIGDANVVGVTHNILQLQYGPNVLAIISSDPTFSPSPAISGFSVINPGITINSHINYFSYGNTTVGQYIPTDSTIIGIQASATASNAAIVTANTAVVSYVNTLNSAMANSVVLANTGVVSYVNTLTNSLNANLTAANAAAQADTAAWQANATAQESEISNLRSNITAANSAIVTANSAVTSYVNSVNAAMVANITAANTLLAHTAIVAGAYGNANVGQYLPGDGTIVAMQTAINMVTANVASANAAIVTANSAVVSYVNTLNSAMVSYVNSLNTTQVSNAAGLTTQINSLRANITAANSAIVVTNTAIATANSAVVSYVNTLNSAMIANVNAANVLIATANTISANYANSLNTAMIANVNAANASIALTNTAITTANTMMGLYVNSLNTAMAANVTAANAAIVTANSAVVSYIATTNSATITYVNSLNTAMVANVTAANAAIANNTYSNTKVANYLPVYGGAILSSNVSVTGPMILAKATRSQLISNNLGSVLGTIAYDTSANAPVYYNGSNWCFFSNNASI